jgi:hypothetical protein
MRKINALIALTALSGGAAGALVYLAAAHAGDRTLATAPVNYPFLIISIIFFSVLFSAGWAGITAFFVRVFGADPKREMTENSLIFCAPLAAAAVLPIFFLFYGRLSGMDLKVTGSVYLPFINYIHFNPAGYFLLSLIGFIIATIAGLLFLKFAFHFMRNTGKFNEQRSVKMVFFAFFLFLAVTTSYVTLVYPPTGDEPHYLAISQSIGEDFDLNLENNYLEGKYKAFYPTDIDYKSIHNTTGKDGRGIYSLHSVGLPVLTAMIQRAGGRYGVQLFMDFLAALLAALFYYVLRKRGISGSVSTAATFMLFTAVPLLTASSLVLTEMPAALIILYCVHRLTCRRTGGSELLLFSGISFLPWLHPKLAVFSMVFYAWYYASLLRAKVFSIKQEGINNMAVIFSAGLMIIFYFLIYGKFAPFALTSVYVSSSFYFIFSLGHMLRATAGMVFDRDFGLLIYAPVYVLSAWGLALAAVKSGFKKAAPALACAPYLALYLVWSDWGGSMFPARQLVPVLPVFGIYAAHFMQETDIMRSKLFKILASCSLSISWIFMAVPALRYVSGREKIFAVLAKLKFNLLWFFPSFGDIITIRQWIIVLYIIAIAALFFRYAGKQRSLAD